MARKDQQSVEKMAFLLATVYESSRLLPAGPLLQRCSLKHGEKLFACLISNSGGVLYICSIGVLFEDAWKFSGTRNIFTLISCLSSNFDQWNC